MRKLVLTCLLSGALLTPGMAQTLFTYGSNPVDKEEFLRVYQKNSLNKAPDLSEPALREYLELYSLFRMKVKEAELMHMDTIVSIQQELDSYRRQLAKNYLSDEDVVKALHKEAYDRMKEEVRVAHILLKAPNTMLPPDTLAVYKKIDSIYKAATKGKADFAALAKLYSEDPGSKDNGGEIGYITALQTVYPFENAAYHTATGKISAPFRTQFGYHIVKVIDRRVARGEIEVAQILINTPKSKGEAGIQEARKRIDTIQAALKKGTAFEDLAKKYSDDRFTVNEGGLMKPFGVGRMTPAFEDAAFALKKPGDVSAPVQTDYGFHIIKLVRKIPLQPYDSILPTLKRRVENDSRAQMARDSYLENVKRKNGFKEYSPAYDAVVARFSKIPDTGEAANTFKSGDFRDMSQPLFTLAGKDYLQSDFIGFADNTTRGRLMGPKGAVTYDLYNLYVRTVVNDFQEQQLLVENVDFRNLMEEYRNGIMLFELMDRNVWGKASRDTVGLKAFYENNKQKYLWEPGFSGSVYRFKDEVSKNAGIKLLKGKKAVSDEDLLKQLNTQDKPGSVSVQVGRFEFSRFGDVPREAIVKDKLSNPVKKEDGLYVVVKATEVYNEPAPKALDEARGYAVAEYQDYLEKEWNGQLRAKYPVQVDEAVFRSMVK